MKTYAAYIRVSTAKQGQLGSSLQEQKDAIRAFAERHNLKILEWYEDRETAAKRGRTQFLRMMAALEKRKAQGVILHKIDRGARNLWDWARLQDLIDAGVEVHFAHDNLDLRSRGGRLAADIQAVVAADYVRNLRDEVRKGMRGRLKQGLYPWRAPVGYLDQGKATPKSIDPFKGPLVIAAFELYATKRYSYATLAIELQRRGLARPNGQPISPNGMTSLLRNPFYMGLIRLKRTGEMFQGIHEPLVDAATFQRVQDIIDGKTNLPLHRREFLYRRLLSCGSCSYALTGETQKGHIYYRCHTKECSTTGLRERDVANQLANAMTDLQFAASQLDEMRPYLAQDEKDHAEQQARLMSGLRLRIAQLEDRKRRLTDAYLDQAIDRETFGGRTSSLALELAQVRAQLTQVQGGQAFDWGRAMAEFFEPLKVLQLSHESENWLNFRQAIESLTSNRVLKGKKLYVSMRSPFQEIAEGVRLLRGEPRRDGLRTCTAQSPESSTKSPTPEQLANLLLPHIKQWAAMHPPGPKERAALPQQFKLKPPGNDNDLQMAA